jgi:hypothetical protein
MHTTVWAVVWLVVWVVPIFFVVTLLRRRRR